MGEEVAAAAAYYPDQDAGAAAAAAAAVDGARGEEEVRTAEGWDGLSVAGEGVVRRDVEKGGASRICCGLDLFGMWLLTLGMDFALGLAVRSV